MELGTGYPGYHTLMPKTNGTIAEVLKQHGYNTSWYGKNHNVPDWHTSQAGPFDLWPTGLGFEYFYGFLGGDTNQWHSAIYENTKPIEAPEQRGNQPMTSISSWPIMPLPGCDAARSAPNKPFFVYYAPGTTHAPHHAPKEWIAKFKGQFDKGWDQLREDDLRSTKADGHYSCRRQADAAPQRDPSLGWHERRAKQLYARMMEVYAGALAHCDYQIGRVIQTIEQMGQLDNTMIIFIQGDNGASAEGTLQGLSNEVGLIANAVPESLDYLLSIKDELGGPIAYNHYPVGWALR